MRQPVDPAPNAPSTPGGTAWGDQIDEQRKQEVWHRLRSWWATDDHDHGDQAGPFAGEQLTGAEVFWLAVCALAGPAADADALSAAEDRLYRVLDDSVARYFLVLPRLQLQGSNLRLAQLQEAELNGAQLQGARLSGAQLQGANFREAQLQGASLYRAQVERARLSGAQLQGANFREAQLQGANLSGAQLEGADFSGASLDKATRLEEAHIRGVFLDRVILDRVNLSVIAEGTLVLPLGDETRALARKDTHGKVKDRATRLREFQAAVRANRLIAVAFQEQGMTDEAAAFAYRAQVLQRTVYHLAGWRKVGAFWGSALLDGLAGYGYKPGRSLLLYVALIVSFAAGYFLLGPAAHLPLSPLEAGH